MQRKCIWKTLALVILMLSLTTGLCVAKFIEDDDGNWVKYYYQDDWNIFYIDTNAIKAREYEGKKYLDVFVRRKWQHVEQLILVNRWVESTNAKWHMLIDIENRKSIALEFANEHNNPKRGTNDISLITTHAEALVPFEEELLAWVEQNYSSVMNEIRQHNQQFAAQHPQANVPTGAVQGGAGTQAVTANGDYGFLQMLEDGPVQYSARMIHKPPTYPVVGDGITRSYVSGVPASGLLCRDEYLVPSAAPDTAKPLYIIYRNDVYEKSAGFGKRQTASENWIYGIFSYDNETNTFTLYEFALDTHPSLLKAFKEIHIIDENNIAVDFLDDRHSVDGERAHFTYEYKKTDFFPDVDGNGWERTDDFPVGWSSAYGELIERLNDNEIGLDGLFVFLARKGNVGYAPPASSNVEYVDQMDYSQAVVYDVYDY